MPDRIASFAIPVLELEILQANEPWLAPICRQLRQLDSAGLGDSLLAHQLVRYIADAVPAWRAAPWRALVDNSPSAVSPACSRDVVGVNCAPDPPSPPAPRAGQNRT